MVRCDGCYGVGWVAMSRSTDRPTEQTRYPAYRPRDRPADRPTCQPADRTTDVETPRPALRLVMRSGLRHTHLQTLPTAPRQDIQKWVPAVCLRMRLASAPMLPFSQQTPARWPKKTHTHHSLSLPLSLSLALSSLSLSPSLSPLSLPLSPSFSVPPHIMYECNVM